MRLASAWSVVLLIAIGISFFAKADEPILTPVAWQLLFPGPTHPYNVASGFFSCWCADWTRERGA